jgi:hypothetical protein
MILAMHCDIHDFINAFTIFMILAMDSWYLQFWQFTILAIHDILATQPQSFFGWNWELLKLWITEIVNH